MAKRYAVYKLKKVKGKREYIVEDILSVCTSQRAAHEEMESFLEDCLDCPVWYNKKIMDLVSYTKEDTLLYVPNCILVPSEMVPGALEEKVIGIYGWLPIYYIDEYPNRYSYYKLHKLRIKWELDPKFGLEGIKAERDS